MALTGTIMAPIYTSPSAVSNFLRIQAGGGVLIPTVHEVDAPSSSAIESCMNLSYVFNGRPYFFSGSEDGNQYGMWTYDENLDKFVRIGTSIYYSQQIPFGEKTLFAGSAAMGFGKFARLENKRSVTNFYMRAYCFKDDIVFFHCSLGQWWWQAPFTGAPTAGATARPMNCSLVEFKGDVYGLKIYFSNPHYVLYKWNGSSDFVQVGSGWDAGTKIPINFGTGSAFFKYNDKLYVASAPYSGPRTCSVWEVNTTTGSATDVTDTVLPVGHPWRAAVVADSQRARFAAVRNDSGSAEQVFFVRMGQTVAAWEVCEFLGGATPMSVTPEATGLQRIYPPSPLYWDRDAKTAQIERAVDSTPSNYLDMTVRTYDLRNGGSVDIDPRYRTGGSEPPPYTVMTELTGSGSEGKTGLSSVPTGVTTLADLSDNFDGTDIDEDLWEIVNVAGEQLRHWGLFQDHIGFEVITYDVTGSAVIPWADLTARFGDGGQACKSKWFIKDEFQIDITLKNLVNLKNHTTLYYHLDIMLNVTTNWGFGVEIDKNSVGSTARIRGMYMAPNTDKVYSGYATGLVSDGTVIRFTRNSSDVWTITLDPGGTPEDITPTGTNISEDVLLWLCLLCGTSAASPILATPGPGFDSVVVSGSGSIGRFDSGVDHTFHWDHVTDLGANVVATPELFVDAET